jgi:hypothetical protein
MIKLHCISKLETESEFSVEFNVVSDSGQNVSGTVSYSAADVSMVHVGKNYDLNMTEVE